MVAELLEYRAEAPSLTRAVELGLEHFACQRCELETEIIQSPRRGWLGRFGSKAAIVRLRICSRLLAGRLLLEELLKKCGLEGRVEMVRVGGKGKLVIQADESGLVIGRHGQVIDSLEYILNGLLDRRYPDQARVEVDCDGYRARQLGMVQRLAKKLVRQARKSGQQVVSEPLSPRQHHLIRQQLQKIPEIAFRTQGQGAMRKLVVAPRG